VEPSTTDSGIEAVRAARRELDAAAIKEIQDVPSREEYLADVAEISKAASTIPIVYLAAAKSGGVGLVVRGGKVTTISLDTLTADVLRDRTQSHLDAYTLYRKDPKNRRPDWSAALLDVTGWLWDIAMGSVLTELGDARQAVIVAGGRLGLLPLHAAWTPDASKPTGRRHALDQVTLSYVPNAKALSGARDRAAGTTRPLRLLSVVEPSNVRGSPLPFTREEALGFAAGARFNDADRVELRAGWATPNNVLHAAAAATVLHLACHGFADLAAPLDSYLLLAGNRRLSLRDLKKKEMMWARLAVLSACETALPGTDLPDEVIGLPTGLLEAGVAGVIASQWSVPDYPTAMLMTEFALRWQGEGEAPSPAAALAGAQQWLRDSTTAQKREYWKSRRNELPGSVIETFLNGLVGLDPHSRGHEDLHNWAAFAHFGA
jgi:hypothetical protein